eukprot:COSAG06_NODE_1474_length_9343_cov_29.287322_10_plen_121_part_01
MHRPARAAAAVRFSSAAHRESACFLLCRACALPLRACDGSNFCIFGGVMRQQFIGFATGVACACEAADIYLDVTLMPFFARHVPPLTQHKRYIDDGCLPNWTGSYASVTACFGDINANNPD